MNQGIQRSIQNTLYSVVVIPCKTHMSFVKRALFSMIELSWTTRWVNAYGNNNKMNAQSNRPKKLMARNRLKYLYNKFNTAVLMCDGFWFVYIFQ